MGPFMLLEFNKKFQADIHLKLFEDDSKIHQTPTQPDTLQEDLAQAWSYTWKLSFESSFKPTNAGVSTQAII